MTLVPHKDARILIPGCGNAPSSLEIYDEGYTNMVCADNSATVIQHMCATSNRDIQWDLIDATCMPYHDASFDVVIDKTLIDCLHCCDDPFQCICSYIDEVFRVLAPGGIFMIVSFQSKEEMKSCLRGRAWITKVESLVAPQPTATEQVQAVIPQTGEVLSLGDSALNVTDTDGQAHGIERLLSVCVKGITRKDQIADVIESTASRSKNGKNKKNCKAMTRRQERQYLAEQLLVATALGSGVHSDVIGEAVPPTSTKKGLEVARKKARRNVRRMQCATWAAEDM